MSSSRLILGLGSFPGSGSVFQVRFRFRIVFMFMLGLLTSRIWWKNGVIIAFNDLNEIRD